MRPRIAVLGGGISGLAAAVRLHELDPRAEILLLESSDRLGGVLHTVREEGFLIEAAADGFLTDPPDAWELCRGIGLEEELLGVDPGRRHAEILHRGSLHPVPAGFMLLAPSRLAPMCATRLLSLRGKLRVALEYFLPPRADTTDESLAAFVRRRFGNELLERLVQPLVGSIYTADPELLSLQATMPRFHEMERRHGGLLRAMLRRRAPAERGGGARFHRFAAPREGMSSLVAALADRLPPGTIHLNHPVRSIRPLPGNRWRLVAGRNDPDMYDVDALIAAAPAPRAARLLQPVDPRLAAQLSAIPYAGCAIAALGYERRQFGRPPRGVGFVTPLVEQRNILSCSYASLKYAGRAPHDHVLLRVFLGGACQENLLRLSSEDLLHLAECEVADVLNIRGGPLLRRLIRHNHAMPQYHVGHLERIAGIRRQLEQRPTLDVIGSALGGVGVPACIRGGHAAAERIAANLRLGPSRRAPRQGIESLLPPATGRSVPSRSVAAHPEPVSGTPRRESGTRAL